MIDVTKYQDIDLVDIFEQMLSRRADGGIRPMLYVSSATDLECNMVMLLGEADENPSSELPEPVSHRAGYHVVMN
ncbi:MAG TPA: hypothetical protein VG778_11775 [Blastocatellia bacterium]|jgi:hypothetical protein|nr:hypothetical protein [Blastocatellia bacterium]